MNVLPPALGQAFRIAAAELGMASAAQLFIDELAKTGGAQAVAELRDRLGREYPVLDYVAARWLAGEEEPAIDPDPVVKALAGIERLLVVGLEAAHLDALLPRLGDLEVGFVTEGRALMPEWRRVLANYAAVGDESRVAAVGLSDFQLWAGPRAALMTFIYGGNRHVVHVSGQWLRVSGPDVRTQFRSLVAWDVLGGALHVYPRWFAEVSRSTFTEVIGP
ncbi:MAG TPA: hypothetical protein ENJ18_07515 [Nannocystis exedens]|nr:hypothetical protein [Nannocystis exedens]